ncbi:glycerol-3-phosphate 1-O-acyltransferase PlsY [Pontiella sulfatireligans]|uniref:Glycerol-3-phosphate acyltransferase n=1 Tax=Pontiella sulfatireligans TaxID=2750658 RepID=A0A6C2UN33_9BACT|nr:glycerol-3-phosphate 1-O-acyltransferase PlsY [Pontiella sulfatireligans]VGO20734.1 Glycerol-3-phosphate acyltransferase [Pontiella sulfatireligans]
MEIGIILLTLAAYLFGAIPFGLLVAKSRGVNIREHGSGNIGATNVFRVVGKGWGIFTFTLDALKGFIPAFFFSKIGELPFEWGVLFGMAAIIGHTFPVYLKFKGGKGVATSAGMLIGIAPVAVAVGFLFWVICLVLSRIVSLASIIAAIAVGITVWVEGEKPVAVKIALSILSLLVVWLHRANIKRLMNGTESRFGKKKEAKV